MSYQFSAIRNPGVSLLVPQTSFLEPRALRAYLTDQWLSVTEE
jgi:hypothetical protein